MTINLYSCSDDNRVANKTLTTITSSVTCKPSEPCSLISPVLLLDYSATYLAANYIYISDFDAYYFAQPVLRTGKVLQLNCKLDVYNSFDLSDVPATVVRSEQAGVNFVPDNKLPVDPSRCWLEGILFPQQPLQSQLTETDNYLLTVNGGEFIVN